MWWTSREGERERERGGEGEKQREGMQVSVYKHHNSIARGVLHNYLDFTVLHLAMCCCFRPSTSVLPDTIWTKLQRTLYTEQVKLAFQTCFASSWSRFWAGLCGEWAAVVLEL